jgi:hypothetical protein
MMIQLDFFFNFLVIQPPRTLWQKKNCQKSKTLQFNKFSSAEKRRAAKIEDLEIAKFESSLILIFIVFEQKCTDINTSKIF